MPESIHPIRAWLIAQYHDVKGNLKTSLLLAVLGGVMSAFHFIIQGLPLWRHVLIIFCFCLLSIWVAIATWSARKSRPLSSVDAPVNTTAKEQSPDRTLEYLFSPLQIEAFRYAKDLEYFLGTLGPEPEIDRSKMSDEAYEVAFQKSTLRTQKLLAGYELRFAPGIQTLVYQFEERGYGNLLISNLLKNKVKNQKDIVYVRAALIALSHSVDGVRLGALEEK